MAKAVNRERSRHLSRLDYANRGFGAIERWLSYIGLGLLNGLVVMVVAEVAARYLFKSPIKGYIDAMEMMMAAVVFLTLAHSQREGGHIRMELFMARVLKGERSYHSVELFHLLVAVVGFAIIAVYSWKCALNAYAVGDITPTVHWPVWPARIVTAAGSAFLCFRFIIQMFQSLTHVIAGGKRPEL